MGTADEVLTTARNEIGYVETPINKTKFNDIFYGRPNVVAEWCAIFTWWALHVNGIDNGHFDNCQAWYLHLAQQHRDVPKPGDLAFFDWNGDHIADHVGFVLQVGTSNILTIEGNTSLDNQSNGGSVMQRARTFSSVLGFARPTYTKEGNVPKAVDACKVPGSQNQHWVLTDDGGVRALPIGKTPFYGSYPGLPPEQRKGIRSFIAIEANDPVDPSKGYTLFADDDTYYSFPTGA